MCSFYWGTELRASLPAASLCGMKAALRPVGSPSNAGWMQPALSSAPHYLVSRTFSIPTSLVEPSALLMTHPTPYTPSSASSTH